MKRMELKEQMKNIEGICWIIGNSVVFSGAALLMFTGMLYITGHIEMEPFDMMTVTGMICILGAVMIFLMFFFFPNTAEKVELKRRVEMLEREVHGMDEEAEEES